VGTAPHDHLAPTTGRRDHAGSGAGERHADTASDMIGMGFFPDEVGLERADGEPPARDART
jgi:hypothetical protein